MPSDFSAIVCVAFTALTAACAGTAVTHMSDTAEVAPLNASGTAQPAAAPAGAIDASLVKAGYSAMRRRGEILYCRNEIITGQRIGTRICLTAGQIQDEQNNVTKTKDLLNQPANRCLGASCNN